MNNHILSVLIIVSVVLLGGCATARQGKDGLEREFRQQLAESAPVKSYGYRIKELRFSPDNKKALVVFNHEDKKMRPDWEFVLTADEFGRYRGVNVQPFYTPGTGNTPTIHLTVTLPAE